MAKEYIATITVTTNVSVDGEGQDALQDKMAAISKAMEYGLGDLIAQGEYNFAGVQLEAVAMDDDQGEDA